MRGVCRSGNEKDGGGKYIAPHGGRLASVIRTLVLAAMLVTLSACGGTSDSTPPGAANAIVSAPTNAGGGSVNTGTNGVGSGATSSTIRDYTVGGTASGILGDGLVLRLNGGPALPLAANGAFKFSDTIPSGSSYLVTIAVQPSNPSQTCVVDGATGAVARSAITTVVVTCTSAPIQFAYGGNHAGIYCFAVNAISGVLVPLAEPQCDAGTLVSVAVDPAGPFVYATDNSESPPPGSFAAVGSVRMYRIDSATGQLVRLSAIGAEPPTAAGALSIAVDPTGHFVYVGATDSVSAYAIDPITGLLTALPGSPFAAAGGYANELAIDPSGRFLYTANTTTNNVSALAIDATTGSLTPMPGSPFAAGEAPIAIAVDPAGRFVFVANLHSSNVSVFKIDGATGALSPAPGSPFTVPCPTGSLASADSLAVDASGAFLFVINNCGIDISYTNNVDHIWGFAIDRDTGALAALPGSPLFSESDPEPPGPVGPYDVTVRGDLLYVSNANGTVSLFAIDEMTGGLTQVNGSPVASGSNMALNNLAFGP
jgi:6-phosphogluconolactonase